MTTVGDDALARLAAALAEVERLRGLLRRWRIAAHGPECDCNLCRETREALGE